jgi:hypothetical protein
MAPMIKYHNQLLEYSDTHTLDIQMKATFRQTPTTTLHHMVLVSYAEVEDMILGQSQGPSAGPWNQRVVTPTIHDQHNH